jgi:CHRD domain-containing protein
MSRQTRLLMAAFVLPAAVALAIALFGARSTPLAAQSAQSEIRYKARLSTVPVDFVTLGAVTGSGSATAILTGSKLTISGTFEGLGGPATVANLHRGPLGIRGPAVLSLTVTKATQGTVAGSFELKPNQIEDLKLRRLYIQIHSEKAPDGNLWGWLVPEERSR